MKFDLLTGCQEIKLAICCDSLTVLAVILSPCEQSPFFSIDTLDKKGLCKNSVLLTVYCGLRLNAHTAKTGFTVSGLTSPSFGAAAATKK